MKRLAPALSCLLAGCFGETAVETTQGGDTGGSTGGATSAWTASGASETGSDESGTSTGAEGGSASEGPTGEPAGDCWDAGEDAWLLTPIPRSALTGDDPGDPMLSPDGLTLYYVAGIDAQRRPYFVHRDHRDAPFSGGTLMAAWPELDAPVYGVWVNEIRDEMMMTVDGVLHVSYRYDGQWMTPVMVEFTEPIEHDVAEPTLDEAGLRIILQQRTPGSTSGDYIWEMVEAERSDLGDGFGAAMAFGVTGPPAEDPQMCPVLSPDGAHLLFGSSSPLGWNDPDALLDVWIAEADGQGGWSSERRIEQLGTEGWHTCPHSVTEDGCTVLINRFGGGSVEFLLATRSP